MDTQDNLESSPSKIKSLLFNKRTLIIGVFCVVLLFVLSIFLIRQENKNGKKIEPPITSQASPSQFSFRAPPEVFFENYDNQSSITGSPPSSLNAYTLKTNFPLNETLSFANNFGLNSYQPTIQPAMVIYNMDSKEKRGIMIFDTKTGNFTFQSYGVLKPSATTSSTSATEQAYAFLKDIKLYDQSLSCSITYKREDAPPTVTFVECHRDWRKIGLPIVNPLGVLNIAETTKLANLAPGMVDRFAPIDLAVKEVNTGDNGKARPDDFNTVTVGVYPDGNIYSIVSNLRWISSSASINANDIITQNQALDFFNQHKAQFSLTIPAGTGFVDWDKVYPKNLATAKQAIIQDISLVYLEKSSSVTQATYVPSYLIRGVASLESGYTVRFVETLPALKSEITTYTHPRQNGKVAGTSTYLAQEKSLQLKTFSPPPTQPAEQPPLTPFSTLPPQETQKCIDPVVSSALLLGGYQTVNLAIPGYGTAVVIATNHTFYLKSTSSSAIDISKVKEALLKAAEDQYVINVTQYLQKNPTNLATVDDVYNLYGKINKLKVGNRILTDRPAPPVNTLDIYPSSMMQDVNIPEVKDVAYRVAVRILNAQNQNQIGMLAGNQDLFPAEVIRDLHLVFYTAPGNKTACYISGESPILFLYPQKSTAVSITTYAPLIYKDPPSEGNSWKVVADPDGTIEDANGITRPYLYYEYDPTKVSFAQAKAGFVVATDKVVSFVTNTISSKLELNHAEANALLADIQKELPKLKKIAYVKISLIAKSEVDKNLPLSISPRPDTVNRIHILISPLDRKAAIEPQLITPITRQGFTVVELGVYIKD